MPAAAGRFFQRRVYAVGTVNSMRRMFTHCARNEKGRNHQQVPGLHHQGTRRGRQGWQGQALVRVGQPRFGIAFVCRDFQVDGRHRSAARTVQRRRRRHERHNFRKSRLTLAPQQLSLLALLRPDIQRFDQFTFVTKIGACAFRKRCCVQVNNRHIQTLPCRTQRLGFGRACARAL